MCGTSICLVTASPLLITFDTSYILKAGTRHLIPCLFFPLEEHDMGTIDCKNIVRVYDVDFDFNVLIMSSLLMHYIEGIFDLYLQ